MFVFYHPVHTLVRTGFLKKHFYDPPGSQNLVTSSLYFLYIPFEILSPAVLLFLSHFGIHPTFSHSLSLSLSLVYLWTTGISCILFAGLLKPPDHQDVLQGQIHSRKISILILIGDQDVFYILNRSSGRTPGVNTFIMTFFRCKYILNRLSGRTPRVNTV